MRRKRHLSQSQRPADESGDGLRLLTHFDGQRILRLFQRLELACQQIGFCKVTLPRFEALTEEGVIPFQVDEANPVHVNAQAVTVNLLEGRASHNRGTAIPEVIGDEFSERGQPRVAIRVGESEAAPHFFNVVWGVKGVPLAERPAEVAREPLADGRLA